MIVFFVLIFASLFFGHIYVLIKAQHNFNQFKKTFEEMLASEDIKKKRSRNEKDENESNTPKTEIMKFAQRFGKLVKEGWVRSTQDLNALKEIYLKKFNLSLFTSAYIMVGIVGTFGGLIQTFKVLKINPDNNINQLNMLFSGSHVALMTSIIGIILFLTIEGIVRVMQNQRVAYFDYIESKAIEMGGGTDILVNKTLKKMKTAIDGFEKISSELSPVAYQLSNAVEKFGTNVSEFKNLQDEYIKVTSSLKNSINDLANVSIEAVHKVQESLFTQETLTEILNKFYEWTEKTTGTLVSLKDNIEMLQELLDKFDIMPQEFQSSLQPFLDETKGTMSEILSAINSLTIKEEFETLVGKLKDNFQEIRNELERIRVNIEKDGMDELIEELLNSSFGILNKLEDLKNDNDLSLEIQKFRTETTSYLEKLQSIDEVKPFFEEITDTLKKLDTVGKFDGDIARLEKTLYNLNDTLQKIQKIIENKANRKHFLGFLGR